jgi:hypothetical protein
MADRDEPLENPLHGLRVANHDEQEQMSVEDRRRVLRLLSAAVAAPVVTVLFHGPADAWAATA